MCVCSPLLLLRITDGLIFLPVSCLNSSVPLYIHATGRTQGNVCVTPELMSHGDPRSILHSILLSCPHQRRCERVSSGGRVGGALHGAGGAGSLGRGLGPGEVFGLLAVRFGWS